jgi:hypothetical protein
MTSLSTSIVRQELLKNPTGILRPNGRVHCNSLAPPPPPEAPLRCAGSALGSHPQGGRPAAHLFSPEHPCHWQGLLTNPTGLRRPERKKSLYRIRSPSLNPRLRSLSGLGLSASHPQGEALAPNPFSSTTPVLLAGTVDEPHRASSARAEEIIVSYPLTQPKPKAALAVRAQPPGFTSPG